MSTYIHKSHNVSVLIYYFVCPAKYWRFEFSEAVDNSLKGIFHQISYRYDLTFLEIGTDEDHFHLFSKVFRLLVPLKLYKRLKV